MDLINFKFPESEIFPDTNPELLEEATIRGFNHPYNPYCQLFFALFFKGGKVKFKKNIPEKFRNEAWTYLRNLMSSFAPAHEDKEAVCAMLLSELVELE